MRTRLRFLIAAASVVAGLLAFFVRLQPSGSATVFREGPRVVARKGTVYIRPLMGGWQCRTPTLGDQLAFDSETTGRSARSDEFAVRTRFSYDIPDVLPADWPSGDWCTSLRARVTADVLNASLLETPDVLLDHRREADDRIAAAIERDLQAADLRATGVSAQIDLPSGFERLRTVAALATSARRARPVIFIGLDGADWQLLDSYMTSGSMPTLKHLVATGAGGVLETDYPPLSPLVWTTMMTGVGPLDHGILDFTRFNPYTHKKEPITSDERRVPAIWNMLTSAGKQTGVFGLWATYAAEPVHGINVSDRMFTFRYSDREQPAGVVWPPVRRKWSEQIVNDTEHAVGIERLRAYLPSVSDSEFAALAQSDNPYADPAAALRRILVETEVYRRLSETWLRERGSLPDLTIVYLQGTDTIGHVFAPFSPPRQPEISQTDYDKYSGVPARYFHEIDLLLAEYVAIAQQTGAVVMIASDHGFHWREGRPTQISSTATATAAKWHRKEGIYLLWGPGIAAAPDHPLRGSVRQVCATLLALTGMPSSAAGQAPLAGAPPPGAPVDYARTFTRASPPPPPVSGRATSEEIAKLRALGYIGSNESTHSAVSGQGDTKTAGAYNNQGLLLRQQHRIDDALAAFEHALSIDPKYASAMWNESQTLFDASRDLDRADRLLVAALQGGLNDAVKFVIERSIAHQRNGRRDRSLRLLDACVNVSPSDGELRMFRGRYRMDAHDCAGALDDFRAAEQSRPNDALTYASAATAEMCLGDEAAARASIERSLQLDPNQPMLHQVLQH